jgi:glutaredoxin
MLLKIIREGLGRTVAFIDQVTRPTPMTRPPEAQRDVDAAVQPMALYQYFACPFCIKTRRAIHRLNLPIRLRDAQNDPEHRAALATDGGKIQVPCLRIDEPSGTRWLYESSDIIAYLEERFGANAPGGGMSDDARTQPSGGEHSGGQLPQDHHREREQTEGQAPNQTASSDRHEARPNQAPQAQSHRRVTAGLPTALCWLGAMMSASAQADPATLRAYQCIENGVKTFSDKPCGRVERRVFLGYSSPKDLPNAGQSLAAETAADARNDAFIDRLELKRAIARAEGRVSDLRKERDAALMELRARINSGAVIHAVQPGQDSSAELDPRQLVAAEMADHTLIEEMQLVSTRYAQDIAVAEQHLEQLQDHLANMEPSADKP